MIAIIRVASVKLYHLSVCTMFIIFVLLLPGLQKTLCLTETARKIAEIDTFMIGILKSPKENESEVLVTKLKMFTSMVITLNKKLKEEHTLDVIRDCRDVYDDVVGYSLLYHLDRNRTAKIKDVFGWDNNTLKNFESLMDKAENAWVELFDCYEKADKTGVSLPDEPTSSDVIDSTNYVASAKGKSNSEESEESISSSEDKSNSKGNPS